MTTALIETTRDRPKPDAELAHAAARGDRAAFEALYERHHRALLSFSRHMLGRVHDAEDVVQHTFLAADAAFRTGEVPQSVRAWLYTVARNRCVSILRARRDDHALPDPEVPSAENLAEEVEQREDLRALLADLRTLPEQQRAALLLAELGALSHAEVAQVLGVRARKVKALVYQARQALLAAAGARAIPCRSIREELAVATGSAARRRHLRDHVARCEGCRAYADAVGRQRASLAAILPVGPTIALRDTVLGCLGGGGSAATAGAAGVGAVGAAGSAIGLAGAGGLGAGGGGLGAGLGLIGAKLLAVAALGGAAAGGGVVAVTAPDPPQREPATRAAQLAPARSAPVVPVGAANVPAAVPARPTAGRAATSRSGRSSAAGRRGGTRAGPPGHARHEARDERPGKSKPEKLAPGRSKGKSAKAGKPAPGLSRGAAGRSKPAPAQAAPARREPPPAKPVPSTPQVKAAPAAPPRQKPVLPDRAQTAEPGAATAQTPGQAKQLLRQK